MFEKYIYPAHGPQVTLMIDWYLPIWGLVLQRKIVSGKLIWVLSRLRISKKLYYLYSIVQYLTMDIHSHEYADSKIHQKLKLWKS